MRTMTRTIGGLLPVVTIFAAALVMLGTASRAQALTCTDVGGVDSAGDCTLSVTFASPVDFTLTIPGDLEIWAGGGPGGEGFGVPGRRERGHHQGDRGGGKEGGAGRADEGGKHGG